MANVHGFRDLNNRQNNNNRPVLGNNNNLGNNAHVDYNLNKIPFINSGRGDRQPMDQTIPYTLKIFCCPTIKLLSVTVAILIIIWAMYIVCCFNGIDTSPQTTGVLAIQADVLIQFGALVSYYLKDGQIWRIFTAAFLHLDLLHISLNTISFLFFLTRLEDIYHPLYTIALMIASIITGNMSSALFNQGNNTITVGSSVMIYGTFGAYISYLIINWKALQVLGGLRSQLCCIIGFIVAISVFLSIGKSVDIIAHLGGLLGGLLLVLGLFPSINGIKSKIFTISGLGGLLTYNLTITLVFFLS